MNCPEAFTFLGLNGGSAQTPEGDKEGGESKEGDGGGVRGDRVLGAFVLGVCAPGFIAKNSGRKRKGALEEKVVWKMA
jgi:hypothetical protein